MDKWSIELLEQEVENVSKRFDSAFEAISKAIDIIDNHPQIISIAFQLKVLDFSEEREKEREKEREEPGEER